MTAIYKRELRAVLGHPYGWLFIAGCLFLFGIYVSYYNLLMGSADITSALVLPIYLPIKADPGYLYIPQMSFWFVLLYPVAGMSCMVRDRRDGTDAYLSSLPVRSVDVVLGKYFALLTVYAIPAAFLCPLPLLLSAFAKVDLAAAYAAILPVLLLGAACIAVCQFMSSLAGRRLTAYLFGAGALLLLYLPMMLQWPAIAYSAPLLRMVSWFFTAPLASFLLMTVCALLIGLIVWRVARSLAAGAVTAAVLTVAAAVLFLAAPTVMAGLVPAFSITACPFAIPDTLITYSELTLGGIVILLSYTVVFLCFTVLSAEYRQHR